MASRNNTKLFIKIEAQFNGRAESAFADETLKSFQPKKTFGDLLSTNGKKEFLLRRSPVHLFRRPKFGANLFLRSERQCTINFIADIVLVLAQHYEIRFARKFLRFFLLSFFRPSLLCCFKKDEPRMMP